MHVYLNTDITQHGIVVQTEQRNGSWWYKVKWDSGYYSWHPETELVFEA